MFQSFGGSSIYFFFLKEHYGYISLTSSQIFGATGAGIHSRLKPRLT
jgi:hypothetical protein